MKALLRSVRFLFLLLFIAGIVATFFYLYNLPAVLANSTSLLDMRDIPLIAPHIHQVTLVTGITMLCGLIALVLQITSRNGRSENVVYVETFGKKEARNKDGIDEETATQEGEQVDMRLSEVNKILTTTHSQQEMANRVLAVVASALEASQGAIYKARYGDKRYIELFASYAFSIPESSTLTFEFGEGLAGQAAKEGKLVNIGSVPDGYIRVFSGLGQSTPRHLVLVPFNNSQGHVAGVAEIAGFKAFSKKDEAYLQQAFNMLSKQLQWEETSEEQPTEATSTAGNL